MATTRRDRIAPDARSVAGVGAGSADSVLPVVGFDLGFVSSPTMIFFSVSSLERGPGVWPRARARAKSSSLDLPSNLARSLLDDMVIDSFPAYEKGRPKVQGKVAGEVPAPIRRARLIITIARSWHAASHF